MPHLHTIIVQFYYLPKTAKGQSWKCMKMVWISQVYIVMLFKQETRNKLALLHEVWYYLCLCDQISLLKCSCHGYAVWQLKVECGSVYGWGRGWTHTGAGTLFKECKYIKLQVFLQVQRELRIFSKPGTVY